MISWWIGCDCISFLRTPKQITMTGWLKATEIYSLSFLENWKRGRASLRALPCLIQLDGCQLFFGSCQPDSSLWLCVHMAFSPVCLSLINMPVIACSESHSLMSDSLWPRGLYSPWNSPSQNTGVGSCSLLKGIFPTKGSNPGLLHCRRTLYQLSM